VFNTAFLDVAVAGDMAGPWTLSRLLGGAKARELYFLPGKFDADEAERIGLVQRLVDDDALGAALEIADGLAAHDREALTLAKQTMWTNLTAPSLDAALALEARAWDTTWTTTGAG
jgi:enoyl-CoA hydratase/carnithine racemase